MFDSLVSPKKTSKRRILPHHHGIVAVTVIVVISGVVWVNALLYPGSGAPVGLAVAPSVTAWLTEDQERTIVPPLNRYPIATLAVDVHERTALIHMLRFSLEGAYDIHELEGMYLYLDGVQVGYPELPDADGTVTFDLDALPLAAGSHQLDIRLTASALAEGSVLQVVFKKPSDDISLSSPSGSVRVLWPFETGLRTSARSGSLGAFVHNEQALSQASPLIAKLSFYAEGEDMLLTSLQVSSQQNLDGSRLDVFKEQTYWTSAVFENGVALLSFTDRALRVLKGRNTQLIFVPADVPNSILSTGIGLQLDSATAEGIHSGERIEFARRMQLL